jgi:hypothetical protein
MAMDAEVVVGFLKTAFDAFLKVDGLRGDRSAFMFFDCPDGQMLGVVTAYNAGEGRVMQLGFTRDDLPGLPADARRDIGEAMRRAGRGAERN